MGLFTRRRAPVIAMLLTAAVVSAPAIAATPKAQFQIAAGDAADALQEFAQQAELQLLFDYSAVQGLRTQAIEGSLEPGEALTRLLNGTGLGFELVNERTISIVPYAEVARSARELSERLANASRAAARANVGNRAAAERPAKVLSTQGALEEEIIVTAEKRVQSLQRAALAVTALAQETVERQQLTDLKSVTTLIPNLQIGTSSTQAAFDLALRGIVSTNRTEVGDAAVAFHMDGFYSPRPQGATILIYDIDRLEALRGPQGTLFGRNANAGVINVVTAKPHFAGHEGSFDVTTGNYDLLRVKGHYNLPLSDTFALRTAGYVERRDGFIEFLPGSTVDAGTPRYDDSNKQAFRLSAMWEPSDQWTVFASAESYADTGAGTIPVSLEPAPGNDIRSALITSPGVLDLRNNTFHLRTDYRLTNNLELSYLFGWARMTRVNVSDQDSGLALDPSLRALPNPPLRASWNEERRTVDSEFLSSQHELQLKSDGGGRLDWILGSFYYEENNNIRFDIYTMDDRGSVPGEVDPGDMRYSQSFIQPNRMLSAWAGFGQATLHLTDSSRVSGGARYTRDTKRDEGGINVVCPTPNALIGAGGIHLLGVATEDIPFAPDPDSPDPVPGTCRIFTHNDVDKDWSKVTWMARFEQDLQANMLGYAMVSTGFKSGVIQDGGTFANPEEVINYELGLKATLLGGAMTVNTVGFYSDYRDILRTRIEYDMIGQHQLVTRNATRADITGVETELWWRPTHADSVQAVFTYLNAQYADYPTVDAQYYVPADPMTPVMNLKGHRLPFAPERTAALIYEHAFELGNGGRLVPRLQTRYQSEMFLTDFNRASDQQPAYTRTDLSMRYESDEAWLVEAFVQNVEDEAVKNNVDLRANQPGTGGVPGFPGVARAFLDPPRTYGLRVEYRFGQ